MWFGLLVGTACLYGLARTVFWHRRGFSPFWAHRYAHAGFGPGYGSGPGYGFGPGFGHGPWGTGHGPWGRRHRGRDAVYSILERLDATPAQEKEIMAALHELWGIAHELRGTLRASRREVAQAFRSASFDPATVAETTFDATAGKFRGAVLNAVSKIHAVLDERQRNMLADILEEGFGHAC